MCSSRSHACLPICPDPRARALSLSPKKEEEEKFRHVKNRSDDTQVTGHADTAINKFSKLLYHLEKRTLGADADADADADVVGNSFRKIARCCTNDTTTLPNILNTNEITINGPLSSFPMNRVTVDHCSRRFFTEN